MSSWLFFLLLAGSFFLLFAIPFWTGRRYRDAMQAYARLKAGEKAPRLFSDAMIHGGAFGAGLLVMAAFFARGTFNAWQDAANGRVGLLSMAVVAFICLMIFRMGQEQKR